MLVLLAEEGLAVDLDIEDATTARHEGQAADDVLIVTQQFVRCAHGTRYIVSTEAVGDTDRVRLRWFGHQLFSSGFANTGSRFSK